MIVKQFKTANPNNDALSASNCYYKPFLLDGMKDLSQALMEVIENSSTAIYFAYKSASYNDHYIDLWEFTDNLEKSFTSGAVHENASHVRALLNLIVTENHAVNYKQHGMSIYFPKEVGLFKDKYRNNDFSKYTGWDDPRLPTVASLKKRGYKPEAFHKMAEHIGLSEVDKTLSKKDFFDVLDRFN